MKYRIYKTLQEAAHLEAQNISAQRLGSKVILRGTANTWAEREAIERAAWSADGIFEVENDIKLAA